MCTFSFIVGNNIPKSVKCIHSATKLTRVSWANFTDQAVPGLGLGFCFGFSGFGFVYFGFGMWEFPRIRGTLFGGPYNTDPTISGTTLGPPLFGNPHVGFRLQFTVQH